MMLIRQNPYRYHTPPGWNDMTSAPRDGTVIEVQCNYGVAPWFNLYKWATDSHGFGPRWIQVGDECHSFTEDESFSWRPYAGSADTYSDPTRGAQETRAYWIRAAGLNPADYGAVDGVSWEQEEKAKATPTRSAKTTEIGLVRRMVARCCEAFAHNQVRD